MMRTIRFGSILLIGVTCVISCSKKQPTSKPVTVEDVLPFGAPVCFPKGMTNASTEPGSTEVSGDLSSLLRTQDLVPEVFIAPTTQPNSFTYTEPRTTFDQFPASTTQPSISYGEPATQPTTLPAGHQASVNHWCALCAAAAQRAAEQGRNKNELATPESDLMIDLPPR